MPELDELKFVRTFDFALIPRTLFEQVKEMDAAMIDRVYRFGPLIGGNPLTLLYVLIDQVNKIKGVLWSEINIIEAIIYVRLLSVDKEYQSPNGELLNKAIEFLFSLPTGPELKKEIWFEAMRPGAYEKIGARRAKRIKMEIRENEFNEKNSKNSSQRHNTPDTSKSA